MSGKGLDFLPPGLPWDVSNYVPYYISFMGTPPPPSVRTSFVNAPNITVIQRPFSLSWCPLCISIYWSSVSVFPRVVSHPALVGPVILLESRTSLSAVQLIHLTATKTLAVDYDIGHVRAIEMKGKWSWPRYL